MVRAFIAVKVECTPLLRRTLGRLSRMGRAVKAVSPDVLHVTLKFLGDVELESTAQIARVLEELASPMVPCSVQLTGMGAFPRPDRPSVVWTGLENAQTLIDLAAGLDSTLQSFGFAAERRPLHPHLTLARIKIKPPQELFEMLAEHATTDFGTALIDAAELLQSELRPDGPRYTTLSRVEFANQ